MIKIRNNVFEADSSTTHSATMHETKDFEDWFKETKEDYSELPHTVKVCGFMSVSL